MCLLAMRLAGADDSVRPYNFPPHHVGADALIGPYMVRYKIEVTCRHRQNSFRALSHVACATVAAGRPRSSAIFCATSGT